MNTHTVKTACGKEVDGKLKLRNKDENEASTFEKWIIVGEELPSQTFGLQLCVSDYQDDEDQWPITEVRKVRTLQMDVSEECRQSCDWELAPGYVS